MTAFNTTLKSSNQIIQKLIGPYCIVAWTLLHLHEMLSGSTYISDSVLSLHFTKTLILKLNKFLNTKGFSRIQTFHRRADNSTLTTSANRDKQNIKQAWLNVSFSFIFFSCEWRNIIIILQKLRSIGLRAFLNISNSD